MPRYVSTLPIIDSDRCEPASSQSSAHAPAAAVALAVREAACLYASVHAGEKDFPAMASTKLSQAGTIASCGYFNHRPTASM